MTEEYLRPQSSFFLKCITLVESLIAVGDVQESIEIIEALLEANPKHPGLHKKKAMALIKHNEF
jgi:DNA-binding SARP family transcriptional activator